MTYPAIASVVEGQGEAEAVQGLLHRLLPWLNDVTYVHCHVPNRKHRGLLLKQDGMAAALRETMALHPRPTGILVMVDADDDCPVKLAQHLLSLARTVRSDAPVFTVIPNREFEAWFLASAPSYAGMFELPNDLEPPTDPERIRDAKGWFSRQMPSGRAYKPATHQKAFVKHLEFEAAHANSRSFRKLCSDLKLMIGPPHSS